MPSAPTAPAQALRPGHWRCLAELEHTSVYRETRELYAQAVGQHGVYLRPTDNGLTVLSLDHVGCRSMVGVGRVGTNQHLLVRLPPPAATLDAAVKGYREKVANLRRASAEECYALKLMSEALNGTLSLPWPNTFFLHQEWRLPSGNKVDLLAVDPLLGSLIVIELKDTQESAMRCDAKKGGTASEQAAAYATEIHRFRGELYPYFERLARALAMHHGVGPTFEGLVLDPEHVPRSLVSWPGERST